MVPRAFERSSHKHIHKHTCKHWATPSLLRRRHLAIDRSLEWCHRVYAAAWMFTQVRDEEPLPCRVTHDGTHSRHLTLEEVVATGPYFAVLSRCHNGQQPVFVPDSPPPPNFVSYCAECDPAEAVECGKRLTCQPGKEGYICGELSRRQDSPIHALYLQKKGIEYYPCCCGCFTEAFEVYPKWVSPLACIPRGVHSSVGSIPFWE